VSPLCAAPARLAIAMMGQAFAQADALLESLSMVEATIRAIGLASIPI
jgi:hypothetical protein